MGDLLATDRPVPPPAKRAALLVGGIVFVVLGVVGWLIPVVTGIPFYIVGFVLLGLASPRAARWINRLDRRLPHRARVALRKAKRRRVAGAQKSRDDSAAGP